MQSRANSTRTPRVTRRTDRTGGGFTIVELLVAIVVIAILIGLLIVAVTAAIRAARRAGDQQIATGLQQGIGQFQGAFDNRLPPLVYDGEPIELVTSLPRISGGPGNREGPVYRGPAGTATPVVATLDQIYVDGGAQFLTGHEAPSGSGSYNWLFNPERDPRYSKFSLPIFLGGTLGEDADGVSGPGMRLSFTNRRGFEIGGSGQVRPVFYLPSNESAIVSSYVTLDEYREHGQSAIPTQALDANPDRTAFVGSKGAAFRYYRWEPSDEAAVGTGNGTGPYSHLNIPFVLIDPRTWDDPQEQDSEVILADLRDANYAVVGAGPNNLFGTEPLALLREQLGIGQDVADEIVRFRAWEDNVVRLGVGE